MNEQGLFDAIADSAVLLDKNGRIINWNQAATTDFGYHRDEVIGKPINVIFEKSYPFTKIIHAYLNNKQNWQAQTIYIKKDGGKGVCVSQLATLFTPEKNKYFAVLLLKKLFPSNGVVDLRTISSDIANNFLLLNAFNSIEQLEKKLRESELRFHLLAENATDIISRHMPDGSYLYSSPATKSAIGYSAEDLLGKNYFNFIHHDDLHKLKKAFNRTRNPSNLSLLYRLKHKDGEYRWFESNIRLIVDEQTQLINEVQLASRDVTDRVLDKKARLRGQQLAHVYRLSTMEEMASGMAHEISQPLAAVVNYTRGCIRHLQSTEYDKDQLRLIMLKAAQQAERAGEIVQRLKNFFCKGQLVKTSCKINHIIRETVSFIRNNLNNTKCKIDFDFNKDIPIILIDKIQIQQVILNLMQNAIEAMQQSRTKDKRILIQTKVSTPDLIEITIRDTGPGFTKEVVNKVFMPFFTTKAHGRGMGLAICRSIIEAHGGQFTINPNTHKDSWIRFSLPISIE